MPKYFHFRSQDTNFDGQLESNRCTCIKLDGTRCRKQVIIGLDYCFIHNKSQKHLQTKQSNIPNAGTGVFAYMSNVDNNHIVFRIGDVICPYNAEIVDNATVQARYGNHTAPYALKINRGLVLDGALRRCLGSLINSTTFARANCSFALNNRTNTVNIKAIKHIKNGTELLISYGDAYMLNEAGVNYATNAKRVNI